VVSTPADVRDALHDARADGKRTVLMRIRSEEGRGSSRCRLAAYAREGALALETKNAQAQ
jgi:hypothetical protein